MEVQTLSPEAFTGNILEALIAELNTQIGHILEGKGKDIEVTLTEKREEIKQELLTGIQQYMDKGMLHIILGLKIAEKAQQLFTDKYNFKSQLICGLSDFFKNELKGITFTRP